MHKPPLLFQMLKAPMQVVAIMSTNMDIQDSTVPKTALWGQPSTKTNRNGPQPLAP